MNKISTISASIMYDYKVINTARNFTWFADEPIELGGKDEGPLPIELFLSSLASCILITLRMYAQRRNWDAGEIHIELSLSELENGVDITKDISFSGNLEKHQIEQLYEISKRSPLSKILSNPIDIKFA
jgi:putative redox protein